LSDLTTPDDFAYAVSALILSESAKRSEGFQHALRLFAQSHKRLGDPRVRESSLNWRLIASEAAQRYLSWLARDNIIFFFNTILPNNSENEGEKTFGFAIMIGFGLSGRGFRGRPVESKGDSEEIGTPPLLPGVSSDNQRVLDEI